MSNCTIGGIGTILKSLFFFVQNRQNLLISRYITNHEARNEPCGIEGCFRSLGLQAEVIHHRRIEAYNETQARDTVIGKVPWAKNIEVTIEKPN